VSVVFLVWAFGDYCCSPSLAGVILEILIRALLLCSSVEQLSYNCQISFLPCVCFLGRGEWEGFVVNSIEVLVGMSKNSFLLFVDLQVRTMLISLKYIAVRSATSLFNI